MCAVRLIVLYFVLCCVDAQQQQVAASDGSECSSESCSLKVPSLLQHVRHSSDPFPGATRADEDGVAGGDGGDGNRGDGIGEGDGSGYDYDDEGRGLVPSGGEGSGVYYYYGGGSGSGDGSGSAGCDWETEEQCYDENWFPASCAAKSEGGCPCPEGEAKCGATAYWSGWCQDTTLVCCDMETEETCYDENWSPSSCAAREDGCPCPAGKAKCGATNYSSGWCQDEDELCCDMETEETCYDEMWSPSSCAAKSDGGCPCPAGEAKCGATDYYTGWCQDETKLCCDWDTEETCYDENWRPSSCAAKNDGGCPCPAGEAKCGATAEWNGWCQDETAPCCDWQAEETCYDENWNPLSCAAFSDGGCPCADGEVKCGAGETWSGYCTSYCPESLMEHGDEQILSHGAGGKGKGLLKGKSKGKTTLNGSFKAGGKTKGDSKGKGAGKAKHKGK